MSNRLEVDSVAGTKKALCPQEFSIVGIGASAGGFEACSNLLKHLPADTGLAFVVIQHSDLNDESLLPASPGIVTNIPIQSVRNEVVVKPDHVYVIPSGWEIVLSQGMFRLMPREQTPAGNMPIDGFLGSLAASCQHRAIGVVLSGTGSDGVLGLEMIKAQGGFTFAQDTQSAKFDEMPHSAFAAGTVDFVLAPEGIAQELIKLAKYPHTVRADGLASNGEVSHNRAHLQGIFKFLQQATGVDFSLYRFNTVQSRIFRRMVIRHIVDPEHYHRFLAETPDEVELLCEECLSSMQTAQGLKDELETAKGQLQSADEELSTVSEELQTRKSDLQRAHDFATSIVDTVREPLVVLDNALCVKKANQAFYQAFGLSEQDTEARDIFGLAGGAWDAPALRALFEVLLVDNRAFEDFELEGEFSQAARKILHINARRLGDSEMILMSIRDITAQKNAEIELHRVQDELRQGQKMEVIGRLAGGIAHDFNNMLTGILGFSEMLVGSLEEGTNAFHEARKIKKASERAAALTHQLLAFSRRQVLLPQVLSLNTAILELEQMLRRLVGDDIALDIILDEELCLVRADPGQMSQVILNLALNARDAMPQGGVLSIRTKNIHVDEMGKRIRDLAPGSYVRLTVTDSGTGMDRETQRHIFEPFYTTKPLGSGTGLGLATVFGIVEQSGGRIQFSSELGRGTSFWVDLPRVEGAPAFEVSDESVEMPTGTETVLVVDDEDVVRELAVLVLRRQGYTVLEARQASEALALCQSHPFQIDLLLTDLLMPGRLNGRQLAEQAIKIRAEMRVLLMSGYTTDALERCGVDNKVAFLQKPFTLQQLARKVRDVLDSSADLNCMILSRAAEISR